MNWAGLRRHPGCSNMNGVMPFSPLIGRLVLVLLPLVMASASAARAETKYATIDEAIARGDVADLKRHLQRDPSAAKGKPDARLAPLHQAILRRQVPMVALLLEHGADPSALDSSGRSPLHLAVDRGDVPVVQALVEFKADATIRDRTGWTPLHLAAAKDRLEIATLILDGGANPNLLSEGGGTPLHEAAASGSIEVIKLLLARGVDPTIRSKTNVTALDLTREYKHPEAEALLAAVGR